VPQNAAQKSQPICITCEAQSYALFVVSESPMLTLHRPKSHSAMCPV
jgi:hypothetical protein